MKRERVDNDDDEYDDSDDDDEATFTVVSSVNSEYSRRIHVLTVIISLTNIFTSEQRWAILPKSKNIIQACRKNLHFFAHKFAFCFI